MGPLAEGASAVTARLRNVGPDAISLATSYHAGKFLRPHAPNGKVWFADDGTVYCRPNFAHYGRLQSQAARMVSEHDALLVLAREAPDFHITGWTEGLHNSRLGGGHPDLCCQTPFGDPLLNALCPSEPEVRRYLRALSLDSAAQPGIAEIAIEAPGFQTYRHGCHHEFELIELSQAVETLLETCFCLACSARMNAAGLDSAALARQARRDLESFFADGTAPVLNPKTDPNWAAVQDCRADTVTSLIAEVRAELSQQVSLSVLPSVQSPNGMCWRKGRNLADLATVANRLEVPAYQIGPEAIAKDMTDVRAAAGAAASIGFILRPTWPHVTGPEDLAACVKSACAAGADQLSFYNDSHMRLQSLDWIAAAL